MKVAPPMICVPSRKARPAGLCQSAEGSLARLVKAPAMAMAAAPCS